MVLAKSLKNKDGEDGEKVGSRSASDAILSPGPGGRLAAAGGGFAVARNLVRIFSSDCPNTPAAVLRTGAADLKAAASAAGPP